MKNAKNSAVIKRLIEQANVSIRYQVLKLFVSEINSHNLRTELENDKHICSMLETAKKCVSDLGFYNIHGATNTHLENLLPMLLDRGLDKSFSSFDDVFSPIIPVLYDRSYPDVNRYHVFTDIVLTPFMLAAGYRDETLVEFYKKRLALTSDFCSKMDFDIFGDQSRYKGIPKTFRNRKVIKPELDENGKYHFPLIYDLYGHAAMYSTLDDAEQMQVDNIIRYVMAEQYQAFPFGYGILREPDNRNRYHAMGWDCVLPTISDDVSAPVLHRMELLATFSVAKESQWFQKGLTLLDSYQDENGMYKLPKTALWEKEACWLLGNHMGLGENRRKKNWHVIEGTFRVLRMKNKL